MKLSSNAEQIARRVATWSEQVTPELARATLQCATVLTAAGKREAPVRTGRLRRSISYVAGGPARYVVSPNVPYAHHVHRGTGRYGPRNKDIEPGTLMTWKGRDGRWVSKRKTKGQKANPFMARALDKSESQIRRIAAEAGANIVTTRG
jgi:HK97 gp10 family phage protein